MKAYRFNQMVNQKIVDGILQGYKNYIQERAEKNSQMKISTAYAWVKGNHIDGQTATECEDIGIGYKKAKAGYTWGYLQFIADNDQSMFIIKNSRYFNKQNVSGGRGISGKRQEARSEENYLKKLSRINHNVDFPTQLSFFPDDSNSQGSMTIFDDLVMDTLEDNDASKLQDTFNKFYIIAYEIDQGNMIASIKAWMPNPADDIAYQVEDLTELINSSTVDLSNLDTSVLENDQVEFDHDSPTATDYDIFHEHDLPSEDEGNNKG